MIASILGSFLVNVKDDAKANIDSCLLYTSDAADERSSVDLGGRRIIKKKNGPFFVADSGWVSVPRKNLYVVRQYKKFVFYTIDECLIISPRQICSTYTSFK